LLAALACTWSLKSFGAHYLMRLQDSRHQSDWVRLELEWRGQNQWPPERDVQPVIEQLRRDAVIRDLPNVLVGIPQWPDRWWEDY